MEHLFLTERRREILAGEHDDIQDDSLAVAKSRIRTRAGLALEELAEVADSPEIDNESVFEPEKVGQLLTMIFIDGQSGLIERDEYTDELYVEVNEVLRLFSKEQEE